MIKSFKKFTIIELIVVVSVLVILFSMLSPALKKTMEQVKARECQNNLSNISRAIFIYVDENDGQLMGPVWGSQRPRIRHPKGWRYAHFSYYLEPYMSEYTKTGEDGATYNSAFICQANAELEMQGLEAIHHRSHYRYTMEKFIDGKLIFGRPNYRNGQGNVVESVAPLNINNIVNPAQTDLLVDSDLANSPWLDDRNIYDYSDHPVHEAAYRNNLYFDGSVRAIDWTP